MRRNYYWLLILLLLGGCVESPWIKNLQVFNEKGSMMLGSQVISIPAPDSRLPDYEKLTYEVRWLGLPVGTFSTSVTGIKNYKGREAYLLEAEMKTNAFLSKIYKIEDRFVSYMDTEKLYTLRLEVYRREGKYKKDAITEFDQTNQKAYFKNFIDNSEKSFDIPEGVHDVLSASYYLTLLPLKVGGRVEYPVYNNEHNYQFFGLIKSKVLIKLPTLGNNEQEAFLVQPYANLKGEKVDKGNVNAYFSSQERRILLLAKLKGPVFTEITISLSKIENGARPD